MAEQGNFVSYAGRWLVLTLCLFAAAPVASAQQPPQENALQQAASQGAALFAQRDYAAALVALNEALAGGLRTGPLLYQAARCQKETKKRQATYLRTVTEALPLLQQAVGGGSPSLADHAYLADAYLLAGNDGAAMQTGSEGIRAYKSGAYGTLESLSTGDLALLGDMAILARDWDVADQALGRIVSVSGDDKAAARALVSLGQGQVSAGKTSQAVNSLQRALDLDPAGAGIWVALARAHYAHGDYAAAAEAWRQVRMTDLSMANEANYASMVLRTLSQESLLRRPAQPLEDLTAMNRTQLEERILSLAGEMNAVAAGLPAKMVQKGRGNSAMDDVTRDALLTLRDLKLRLAWVAAGYIDRGHPIREFAFSRGFQSYLRDWNLPRARQESERDPLPMEWLSEAQQEEYAKQEERRQERKAQRAARKAAEEKGP